MKEKLIFIKHRVQYISGWDSWNVGMGLAWESHCFHLPLPACCPWCFCNPAVVAVGVANPLDLVLTLAGVHCMFLKNLLNFIVSVTPKLELGVVGVAMLNSLIHLTLMVNWFLLFGPSRTT